MKFRSISDEKRVGDDNLTTRPIWDGILAKHLARGPTRSVVRFWTPKKPQIYPPIGFCPGFLVLAREGRWTSGVVRSLLPK